MKHRLLWFGLLLGSAIPVHMLAQSQIDSDTGGFLEYYAGYYQNTYKDQAVLFGGKVQQPLTRRTESLYLRDRLLRELDETGRERFPTPVPARDSYGEGSLLYDGVFYTGLSLRLDLYQDELVVRTPNEVYGVILDPTRVGYAEFRNYRVEYIPAEQQGDLPTHGYYQVLHDGTLRVLRKEFLEFNRLEERFVHRTVRYYIQKEGAVYRVRPRKGSILKALGGHRREMDQFIRRYGDLKQDMDQALVQIVSEYERLNP